MGLLVDRLLEPFVFLPEVAGEGDEQHGRERPGAHHDHQPQGDGLAGGGASGGQRHASGAQLRLVPHVQRFLDGVTEAQKFQGPRYTQRGGLTLV